MANSCSIVPFKYENLQAQCAWPAGELVFPAEEAARLLGIRKDNLLRHIRHRHPEVKLPPKVFTKLANTFGSSEIFIELMNTFRSPPKVDLPGRTTFGSSLTEFGEVTLPLDTPGGPQPHLYFTLYGLFRHAVYVRTEEARRFVLAYPSIVAAILAGEIKSVRSVPEIYRNVFAAPWGQRDKAAIAASAQLGISPSSVWRHCKMIAEGKVD